MCVNKVPYGFPMTTLGTLPAHADTEEGWRGEMVTGSGLVGVGWGNEGRMDGGGGGGRVFATCGI